MIINEIEGSLREFDITNRVVDYLEIEWFESTKRIQRKKSKNGQEVAIKFLKEGQRLNNEEQMFIENHLLIVQLALAMSKTSRSNRPVPVRGE